MRAQTHERARRQWEQVLQGRCTEGPDGELIYRWPGSPLRLSVEIDPSAPEGALCIEYASDRAIALPEGRHPVLGAAFVRQPFGAGGEP